MPKPAKAKPVKLPVSSSVPPKFPARQEAMYRETLILLNRCRVPYAVAGAFALQVHTGIWRSTKDIDLFVAPEDMPAAICCLTKNGFRCKVKDPIWLHKAHRNGFFVDLITGMSNAVITVEPSWIKNARPAMVLDVRARVLAAEELLVSRIRQVEPTIQRIFIEAESLRSSATGESPSGLKHSRTRVLSP